MPRLDLKRIVGGPHRPAIQELLELLGEPIQIEDRRGRVVFGAPDALDGTRIPVVVDGAEIGAVRGRSGAERIALALTGIAEAERDKLSLASETLDRYKELSLLYEISDEVSRVLDVGSVCRLVIDRIGAFLRADGASLILVSPNRRLESAATFGDASAPSSEGRALIERVIDRGQPELVEEVTVVEGESDTASVLCAPLRTGEQVYGLVYATSRRGGWSAAEVKLLGSLAANVGGAIRHAMLHRDQLREQTLRSHVQRFVSPALLSATGDTPPRPKVPVLVCDLGDIARSVDANAAATDVIRALEEAVALVLSVLMAAGATVNLLRGEMAVAVFSGDDPDEAARAAVDAAVRVVERLLARVGPAHGRGIGVGVCEAQTFSAQTFTATVAAAAMLQAASGGRILVDHDIAAAVGEAVSLAQADDVEPPNGIPYVREVCV